MAWRRTTENKMLSLQKKNQIFDELLSITKDYGSWSFHEAGLNKLLSKSSVFLGGDGVRPYVSFNDEQQVLFSGILPRNVSPPPLIDAVMNGNFGSVEIEKFEPSKSFMLSIKTQPNIIRRLKVPNVLLIGLGDPQRYRGYRLPLGIARLSQWLRFTHAASVKVIDYSTSLEAEECVLSELRTEAYDIIGISVNFGQWKHLEKLASILNSLSQRFVVVLGNILAAFSPSEAAELFTRHKVLIASGFGEYPLMDLCGNIKQPKTWQNIAGLFDPLAPSAENLKRREDPPSIVFPDDELVGRICKAGGQVSIETSFGCQYDKCTFCPRKHRGSVWSGASVRDVQAVLNRITKIAQSKGVPTPMVSFVDEEFFGADGLIDAAAGKSSSRAEQLMQTCYDSTIEYEIYTRVEQIFARKRSNDWNLRRASLLAKHAPRMRRVFLGVESGSPKQLRRYGKGQTVEEIMEALRVGSIVGLPMEFGFITFDPRLSALELIENIEFLARRDLIASTKEYSTSERIELVGEYIKGRNFENANQPLYLFVAYMATELEVLANSRYGKNLKKRYGELIQGSYDPNFARITTRYTEPEVSEIAGWCRVWTEGMFESIYEARMRARSSDVVEVKVSARNLVEKYRSATFALLIGLTNASYPQYRERLRVVINREAVEMPTCNSLDEEYMLSYLDVLRSWVFESTTEPYANLFNPTHRLVHRQN